MTEACQNVPCGKLSEAPPNSRKRAKSGFTIVEFLVFILVIGIVMTGAFATMTQSLRMVETSRDYARASQILQSEIERLRTMSWEQLEAVQTADGSEIRSLELDAAFQEAFSNRYKAFRYIEDRYTDQKQAVVWVYWWDAMGNFRIKQTAAWFTENGLNDFYYRSF